MWAGPGRVPCLGPRARSLVTSGWHRGVPSHLRAFMRCQKNVTYGRICDPLDHSLGDTAPRDAEKAWVQRPYGSPPAGAGIESNIYQVVQSPTAGPGGLYPL